MSSSHIPTPVYHPPADMSPLSYKQLRMESATQSITLTAVCEVGETVLSSCLSVPLGPEGDMSMDTVANFNGALGSPELALVPITIPTLPALPPKEAKPAKPETIMGVACNLMKLDAASHAVWLRQAALEQRDKQTTQTYSLAVSSYEKWWG